MAKLLKQILASVLLIGSMISLASCNATVQEETPQEEQPESEVNKAIIEIYDNKMQLFVENMSVQELFNIDTETLEKEKEICNLSGFEFTVQYKGYCDQYGEENEFHLVTDTEKDGIYLPYILNSEEGQLSQYLYNVLYEDTEDIYSNSYTIFHFTLKYGQKEKYATLLLYPTETQSNEKDNEIDMNNCRDDGYTNIMCGVFELVDYRPKNQSKITVETETEKES